MLTDDVLRSLNPPLIHVNRSNAEHSQVCNVALVGGQVGGNWWLIVFSFNNSRVAWLNDETSKPHLIADCPYVEARMEGDHFAYPKG